MVAAAAAVVGAASLGFAFRSDGTTDQEMELVASQGTTSDGTFAFTVRATPVEGLYPGARRKLNLTLTNPYKFDLQMTAMRAELVSTSKPGCAPTSVNLDVQPYTGTLPTKIPARDSRETGAIPLHMPNSVANDCQKAVFTIQVTADATRAGR
jgi:hypothetical protein